MSEVITYTGLDFQPRIVPVKIHRPTLRQVALLVAETEEDRKVREVGGNNRGPAVERYLAEAGVPPGSAWCAAFINWCAYRAAEILGEGNGSPLEDVPLEAYVQSYVNYGRKHDWVIDASQAEPGDLFCLYYKSLGRYGHVGFVLSVDLENGTIETVEGNTGSGGTREGDGVYKKTRRITDNVLFLRWSE